MECHVLCSAFRVDGFDAFCRRACTSGFGFRTDGIADIPHALDSPKRVKALKYHLVSAKDVETFVRLFYISTARRGMRRATWVRYAPMGMHASDAVL